LIDIQFNVFNRRHEKLCKYIESKLVDPSSFEEIESKYIDQGNQIVVIVEYTAKNGFGVRTRNYCKARVDINGDILEIIENVQLY